jgi:putative pyruvate formate lyase activating enzyme
MAVESGLSLPLVYNTGGYDSLETLALLQGVVDIYMPDVKLADPETARALCGAADYPATARRAIMAMHAQVGDLRLDSRGLAARGLLVRHLILPGGLAGTREWMEYLTHDISPNTYVNLMDQYRPCAQAPNHPPLDRSLSPEEFREARQKAEEAGITRFDERTPPHIERLLRAFLDGSGQ